MRAREVSHEAPFQRTCAWCGNEFAAASGNAQYCSASHKQAHYRWRTKIGVYGREAIVRIDNLVSYVGREKEVSEAAIGQLKALRRRIDAALHTETEEFAARKKEKGQQ